MGFFMVRLAELLGPGSERRVRRSPAPDRHAGDVTPWTALNRVEAARLPHEVRIEYERRLVEHDDDWLEPYDPTTDPALSTEFEYVPSQEPRIVETRW